MATADIASETCPYSQRQRGKLEFLAKSIDARLHFLAVGPEDRGSPGPVKMAAFPFANIEKNRSRYKSPRDAPLINSKIIARRRGSTVEKKKREKRGDPRVEWRERS